jgi:hypothetical protein
MDGLQGLGVINTDNASATIDNHNLSSSTPPVIDNRKFETDMNKFSSVENFCSYTKQFMIDTGVLNVQDIDNTMFSATFQDGETYLVVACPTVENLQSAVNYLQSAPAGLPAKRVAVGFFYADSNVSNLGRQAAVEVFGYNEILDLNNAISSADNKMPYMHIGVATFETKLAKLLNAKHKETATGSIGSQFSSQASGVGAGLGAAFSEGFGQLKQSLFGFGKDLGIIKDKNQQTVAQQPVQNMGQPQQFQQAPQQFHQAPVNNVEAHHEVPSQPIGQTSGVSLNKEEHQMYP